MDKSLENLALELAQKWESIWNPDDPRMREDFEASLHDWMSKRVFALAMEQVKAATEKRIDDFADQAVRNWLKDSKVILPSPNEDVRKIVAEVLGGLGEGADGEVYSAAQRLRFQVYRLVNGGMKKKDVAGGLNISPRNVGAIYAAAERRVAALKRSLGHYGVGVEPPA